MRALSLCEGCQRYVRETETRCPFCDAPRVPTGLAPLEAAPRSVSRAMLVTMGASLAISGCSPHPVIAAPYGAPPPDSREGPQAFVPNVAWRITLPHPITRDARAQTPLRIHMQNPADVPAETSLLLLTLLVNGQVSPQFAQAVAIALAQDSSLRTLPARGERELQLPIVEALLPEVGEYLLALQWNRQPVAVRSVTVRP